MRPSDRFRQSYCDFYPATRNDKPLNMINKTYVVMLAAIITSVITYFC